MIDIDHNMTHTHVQNGLAKLFIKCLKFITRPLTIIAFYSLGTCYYANNLYSNPAIFLSYVLHITTYILVWALYFKSVNFLIVSCLYQLHHLNVQRRIQIIGQVFIMVMNLFWSLSIWSPWRVIIYYTFYWSLVWRGTFLDIKG